MVTTLVVITAGGAAARSPSVVRPGGVLVTRVGGFAASAVVTERIDNSRSVRTVRADRHGVVAVSIRVPVAVGRHRLVLVGRVAGLRRAPAPPRGLPGGDAQAVVAEVPRLVVVPFVVRAPGRFGTAGAGAGRDADGGRGVDAESTGRLADTGTDLGALLGWAGVSLLLGSALVAAGRRSSRESPRGPVAGGMWG